MKEMLDFFNEDNWELVSEQTLPEKEGKYCSVSKLRLSKYSKSVLSQFPDGIYHHQWEALSLFKKGKNVCLSTKTASGKSLVFYVSAIEKLAKNKKFCHILAIYPLKALGLEQHEKWIDNFKKAGITTGVSRIDGSIRPDQRLNILKENQVIVITPDVIHAWLLYNINKPEVSSFLSKLGLIIIDEAHTYSGVFGSNAAYLFRRLNHLVSKFGGHPQYIAASATINNPAWHLKQLVGLDFKIIDQEQDSSPRYESKILMVNPPSNADLLSSFSYLMTFIAAKTKHQFIAFVDSRKQTEYLATMISARQEKTENDKDFLMSQDILPYRAGYEEGDRKHIQQKLTNGQLSGVISTSALEMGLDIPHLTLAALLGLPNTATSFYQRIGRVGRHGPGTIIIVNNGTILNKAIFRQPELLMEIPLSESTLYLDNPRIQYIHALCLAREGGEDDAANQILGVEPKNFKSRVEFPEHFMELCHAERIGEISSDDQLMKSQAGDDPNHRFPLRDVEVQYRIHSKQGPHLTLLGSLSYGQMMREAYPGAVYYYLTQAYRVYRIYHQQKLIEVRKLGKPYSTKPLYLPALIYPNFSVGNIYQAKKLGNLVIVESHLQISEIITGYKETRGKQKIKVSYPLDRSYGYFFNLSSFKRNYFTTGVVINHPLLNDVSVKNYVLSALIFEAFLMTVPFDSKEIKFGSDKHRAPRDLFQFEEGDKFLAIFDQTYGSLRLTSRLMETEIIRKTFEKAVEIASYEESFGVASATLEALKQLYQDSQAQPQVIDCHAENDDGLEEGHNNFEKVLLPGSKGLNIRDENKDFLVTKVFYHPRMGGIVYAGYQEDDKRGVDHIIPIAHLVEIPGESQTGFYNYETGEVGPNK